MALPTTPAVSAESHNKLEGPQMTNKILDSGTLREDKAQGLADYFEHMDSVRQRQRSSTQRSKRCSISAPPPRSLKRCASLLRFWKGETVRVGLARASVLTVDDTAPASAINAQGQSSPAPTGPTGGDIPEPIRAGEIGPDLFRKACEFGLEGLVSKHRDRPYQGGRSKYWIKVKNRKHHAFDRVQEAHRSRVA